MRLFSILAVAAAFAAAGGLSLGAARLAVDVIEDTSRQQVRDSLAREGLNWPEVHTDGLQVFLAGTAPTEAGRFKALSVAGGVVDAARVIDSMLIEETDDISPPGFSIELLRNDSGVSMIGLLPAATDRSALLADVAGHSDDALVTDLMDSADYPAADTWDDALRYAVRALEYLPRAKISISAARVRITATAKSPEEKRRIETDLARRAPADVALVLDISAPRPVITPFTLRFVIDDRGARFDACAADSPEAQTRILRAAGRAGLQDRARCTIGLGVPSPHWGRAAELAIDALARLGGGSVTLADADIALRAAEGTPQTLFDEVAGRLDTTLPEVFALNAVLPRPPEDTAPVTPEFIATLSPEGLVQLRGRIGSDRSRDMVASFARARFRADAVHVSARVVEGLPATWPQRVLTALEALSHLSHGAVSVTPDSLRVQGRTGHRDTSAEIAGLLSEKLGEAAQVSIDVTYHEALDPAAKIPDPEACEARIAAVLSKRQIKFEPGSSTIDSNGAAIMDRIATILKECGEIRMEVAGHTDSQGREEMNQQLSEARARAVLAELRMRRVLTSALTAKGYGESTPIADNGTEEGREANRRIEFSLIRPEPLTQEPTGLASPEQPVDKDGPKPEREEDSADEQD